MRSAVWSLTLTPGFYFVNGNVRFSGLERFRSKYWCRHARSPQFLGVPRNAGRLFCDGSVSSRRSREAVSRGPTNRSRHRSLDGVSVWAPRTRVKLGKRRLLCYKDAAYTSVGCDPTIGNPSCPHRLVWPRTSALQAENGGSNPPGDTIEKRGVTEAPRSLFPLCCPFCCLSGSLTTISWWCRPQP